MLKKTLVIRHRGVKLVLVGSRLTIYKWIKNQIRTLLNIADLYRSVPKKCEKIAASFYLSLCYFSINLFQKFILFYYRKSYEYLLINIARSSFFEFFTLSIFFKPI